MNTICETYPQQIDNIKCNLNIYAFHHNSQSHLVLYHFSMHCKILYNMFYYLFYSFLPTFCLSIQKSLLIKRFSFEWQKFYLHDNCLLVYIICINIRFAPYFIWTTKHKCHLHILKSLNILYMTHNYTKYTFLHCIFHFPLYSQFVHGTLVYGAFQSIERKFKQNFNVFFLPFFVAVAVKTM